MIKSSDHFNKIAPIREPPRPRKKFLPDHAGGSGWGNDMYRPISLKRYMYKLETGVFMCKYSKGSLPAWFQQLLYYKV